MGCECSLFSLIKVKEKKKKSNDVECQRKIIYRLKIKLNRQKRKKRIDEIKLHYVWLKLKKNWIKCVCVYTWIMNCGGEGRMGLYILWKLKV